MQIPKVYSYCVMLFMFKFHNNKLPCIFNGFFIVNNTVHDHFTRQSSKLHVPVAKNVFTAKSIRHTGVFLWNSLSPKLNTNNSMSIYKYSLKQYLLGNEVKHF